MKTNRVDELANKLARAGQTNRIEAALNEFDLTSATEEERESWQHLRGIAAFQRGDHDEARRRFRIARDHYPKSASIAFSLGQEEEYAGEIDRAFELFREVRFPAAPASFVLAAARYAYLWDHFDDGLSFLEPLFGSYEKLGILDDHFLYVRGLPFFGTTWSTAAALHTLKGTRDDFRTRTEKWSKALHDYDFGELLSRLDFDAARRRIALRRRISELEKSEFPAGDQRTELAVLESQVANSLASAKAVLDQVRLEENDHRWLADILLLARCAAHERFGQPNEELVSEFLQKQPYLFEPEHAFHFHLIDSQERLKPRYRAQRG